MSKLFLRILLMVLKFVQIAPLKFENKSLSAAAVQEKAAVLLMLLFAVKLKNCFVDYNFPLVWG